MKTPNALVIRTAGTNCDRETYFALTKAGFNTTLEHINMIEKKSPFDKFQLIAIPGGFSYGDDISAGKVFSNELIFKFGEDISNFIKNGNLIIGICNGFQVLVKTGILPGTPTRPNNGPTQIVTLTTNDSNRFEDRWVYLKTNPTISKFVQDEEVISLPIAHAEGKFVTNDAQVLNNLRFNNQIVFQYCDKAGEFAPYPANPNGSQLEIAGICDLTGQVLGMMPHPERFWTYLNHPQRANSCSKIEPSGNKIFKNAFNYAKSLLK